ncbi:hypothetical protein V1291_004605 [Nitrobacteraceae bacterium AZCC 1564]
MSSYKIPDLPPKINGLLVMTKRSVLWLTFFGLTMALFSGWSLYEWYVSGQLFAASRFEPSVWISYSDAPDVFVYLAYMHIVSFVFFTIGSVYFVRLLLMHRYIDPEAEPLPPSNEDKLAPHSD